MTSQDAEQPEGAVTPQDQASALAERLLVAHRLLREVELPQEAKAQAARRLMALTDASKQDVGRAAVRLEVFLTDLQHGRVTPQ